MLGLWQGPAVGCHKAAARSFRSAEQSASAIFLTWETDEVCLGNFDHMSFLSCTFICGERMCFL